MEIKTPKLNEILNIGDSIKEYRKLKIAEKELNISLEESKDLKNFHKNNTLFLVTKWLLIGATLPKIVSTTSDIMALFYHNIENSSLINLSKEASNFIDYNTLTSLLILSGALYLTVAFGKYKDLNIVEHKGIQSYKNEILSISKLNHKEVKDELSTNEIYKIYLIGNHLYEEDKNNMFKKIINFTKKIISKFDENEKNIFKNFKNYIFDFKKYYKNEKNYEKEIKSLNNPNDYLNKEFLKKYKTCELNDSIFVKQKLKEFNNKAIENAIIHYTNQNLQLLMSRIIKDITVKGLSEDYIKVLKKIEHLKDVNSIKNKDTIKVNKEIKNISRIANDILNGRCIFEKKDTLLDIIKKINPEMVNKDKVKYGSLNSYIIQEKKNILKNNKNNEFESYIINEIEFNKKDLEDFENIISIKKNKLKNIIKEEYLPKQK